jgi:hypothetical protein
MAARLSDGAAARGAFPSLCLSHVAKPCRTESASVSSASLPKKDILGATAASFLVEMQSENRSAMGKSGEITGKTISP